MPIRPHTASKAQETAEAIQTALTQRSLDVHDVRTWGDDCVEIDVIDAHPQLQRAVKAVASPHQRGHSNIPIDAYVDDNRRPDLPQVKFVLVNFKWTEDLRQRAVATAERTFDNFHDTQLNEFEYVQLLLHGSFPQFWSEETGEINAPRCCACQLPIEHTADAWSYRTSPERAHRLYRCQHCGDFHPTPPAARR